MKKEIEKLFIEKRLYFVIESLYNEGLLKCDNDIYRKLYDEAFMLDGQKEDYYRESHEYESKAKTYEQHIKYQNQEIERLKAEKMQS